MLGAQTPILRRCVLGALLLVTLAAASARETTPVHASNNGLWIAAGSMTVARERPTATLLSNGKVLLVGGNNSSTNYVNDVELYDPAADAWTAGMSLTTGRSFHTATRLPNGKVLVVGGFGGTPSANLASAELYDPVPGTWSSANSLGTPRRAHTATLLPNGNVLIAGGVGSVGATPEDYLKTAELYTPSTNLWAPAMPMAHVRESHTATLLPVGRVLIAGGFDGDYVGTVELYDPVTNAWSPAPNLATARRLHTATMLGTGRVLVTGGGGAAGYLASAELYDAAANAWTPAAPMGEPRAGHAATRLADGRVLVDGGANGVPATLATAEIYVATADTWEPAGTMGAARVRHTATLLNDGGVLVAGGSGASYLNSAELWDADSDGDGVPNRHEIAPGCLGIVYTGYAGPLAQMTKPCNPDTDGDGFRDMPSSALSAVNTDSNVDNCPTVANSSQINTDGANAASNHAGADVLGDACDLDRDGDGYPDALEIAMGKNPNAYCIRMRADVDGDGSVSILDLARVARYFIQSIPPAPERYNQDNGASISILDLAIMATVFIQPVSGCP